jgi:Bacterial Ig domain
MKKRFSSNSLIVGFILILIITSLGAAPASPNLQGADARPQVSSATRTDTTGELRHLPPNPPIPSAVFELFNKPRKWLPNRQNAAPSGAPDTTVQTSVGPSAPSTSSSFEGISNVNGVLPPDTNGDIGPNYYIQIVNLSFEIFNRSGASQYGPANINTLWSGFGGPCETSNDGDPVVLYDHLANRWLISQFALPRFPRGPFYQCLAVSTSGDPLGSWHRYEFTMSSSKLNDYPKFGLWPDGYYMTMNQFTCNFITCNWAGQGVVVFERDQMLTGGTARMVYFDLYNVDPNLGGMLPSDLDGPLPPAGAPNTFVQVDDNAWGYSPDQLQLWNFHVNWSDPTTSTFTQAAVLPVAAFDSNMCGYSRNCIPQPGGVAVDALSDRLMYRLQYRNFGDHQTLVVNHTVDSNGSDRAGVRWYELRDSGGGWGVYQQATYAPDSANRWVGSLAMNGAGDMGLGYSVSSSTVYPSIRFTGRLGTDSLNQMTLGEGTIIAGTGYQSHSSGRWGDYASMSVDPVDDCTFWFTSEYYTSGASAAGWQTRVGSFKLSNCSGGPVDNPPSVNITNPTDGTTVSGQVNVTADASDDHGVTQVQFFVDGSSLGVDTDGSNGWSANWDTTLYTDASHTVSATATDTIAQTGSDSNTVTVSNAASLALHVGDLDGSAALVRKNWNATVVVTVHDASHNPVANVTVSGQWSGGYSGSASCVTNSSGQCSASTGNISSKKTSVTFMVTNLSLPAAVYNSASNHDPDGDSNGTVITIAKP